MLADIFLQSKEFQKLIFKGRDQQFLTPEEINDAIPASIVNPDDIDKILMKVFEMRIEVQAAGTEEVVAEEGIRLDGAEIIEETLSREEKAELRSASTDPVKLYLKRMGSVALLTREGEVEIAKQIEEGEREIITSSLTSSHALKEIIKLKDKIECHENPTEFVKELVRGLDDESAPQEIKEVKDAIYAVIDELKIFLKETEQEDGTLRKFTVQEKKQFEHISAQLADLTFNRKLINSFVEPVKKYFLQFNELYESEDRIYKFLEVKNTDEYKILYERIIEDDNFKRKLSKDLFTTEAKIEQLIRNEEDVLRKLRRLTLEAGMEYL